MRIAIVNAPILTVEVATRIERALANAAESRARPIKRLPGNPLGIEIRRWEHLTGILVDATW